MRNTKSNRFGNTTTVFVCLCVCNTAIIPTVSRLYYIRCEEGIHFSYSCVCVCFIRRPTQKIQFDSASELNITIRIRVCIGIHMNTRRQTAAAGSSLVSVASRITTGNRLARLNVCMTVRTTYGLHVSAFCLCCRRCQARTHAHRQATERRGAKSGWRVRVAAILNTENIVQSQYDGPASNIPSSMMRVFIFSFVLKNI